MSKGARMLKHKVGTCLLLAGLVTTQIAPAAEVDFAGLVQHLPASLPGSAIAAAQSQSAGTATAAALSRDIDSAREQVAREQANRLYAGTELAPGTDDAAAQQARMQAMAQQMQGMSQQQQIAMAMQMQQQVQANMGLQSSVLAPDEQKALVTLMQDPQRSNQMMQSGALIAQQAATLRQGAETKHRLIQANLDQALVATQKMTLGSDARCAAQAARQKSLVVEAANQHVAVVDQLLGQLQPLYVEYRKRSNDELQHLNVDIGLAAKIKDAAKQKQAAQAVSTARQATLAATQQAVEFYKQSFDDLHWLKDRDRVVSEPAATGCGGEG